MTVSHIKSNAVADWTGTVTVFNSQGSTTTAAATGIVRPSDWNSAHSLTYTLSGNTLSTSVIGGTNIVYQGGSNITLQGSTAADVATMLIHGTGPPTLSFYDNLVPGSTATLQLSNGALHVFPLQPANEVMPGNLSALSIFLNVTGTVSTAQPFTISYSIGFFTSVNSTQLTRVFSASSTWGTNGANANINNSFGGWRWLPFLSSQFNAAPNFSDGVRYWVAIWSRSSSGTPNFTHFGMQSLGLSNVRSGIMGAVSQSDTTLGWGRFQGFYSVSFATAMPSAIAGSDIQKNNVSVMFVPQVILNNVGSNIV